jgi:hypothetical protein
MASSVSSREPSPTAIAQCGGNNELRHRPAENLIALIAERSLGRGIEIHDATFVIDRDDAVKRRVENAGFASLAVGQPLFRLDDSGRPATPRLVQRADDSARRTERREGQGHRPCG